MRIHEGTRGFTTRNPTGGGAGDPCSKRMHITRDCQRPRQRGQHHMLKECFTNRIIQRAAPRRLQAPSHAPPLPSSEPCIITTSLPHIQVGSGSSGCQLGGIRDLGQVGSGPSMAASQPGHKQLPLMSCHAAHAPYT